MHAKKLCLNYPYSYITISFNCNTPNSSEFELTQIFWIAKKMARIFFLHFSIQSLCTIHCMKSVQIRSFFRSVFSRIRTEYGEIRYLSVLFSPNAGKYGPEKTPYLDTFHAVIIWVQALNSRWDSQLNSIYLTNMIPTI